MDTQSNFKPTSVFDEETSKQLLKMYSDVSHISGVPVNYIRIFLHNGIVIIDDVTDKKNILCLGMKNLI